MHGWVCTQARILLDALPIGIIRYDARLHGIEVVIDDCADGFGDGFQHLALFHGYDMLECVDIRRMDWKHVHVILQAVGHILIQWAEFLQVIADQCLLLRRLAQDAALGNESNIFRANQNLLEAIFHFQQ